MTKVRSRKKKVVQRAQKEGRTVHFATLMDICHPKNSELEPRFQKFEGRVVPRGDIAKDDLDSYAVLPDGSSQVAAGVVDAVARRPGAGRAVDAVPAHLRSQKMEDAPASLKLPTSDQTSGYVYHDTSGPNHGPTLNNQLFLLMGASTKLGMTICESSARFLPVSTRG